MHACRSTLEDPTDPSFFILDDITVSVAGVMITCCNTTDGTCTLSPSTGVCPLGTTPAAAGGDCCTPGMCPQPIACCNTTDGSCLTQVTCPVGYNAAPGGAVVCGPNPCPQPTACCNTTDGTCLVVLPLAACPAGHIPSPGGGSVCGVGICPQPTACCNLITGSCVVALPSIACPVGTVAAPGGASSCTPASPCPFPGDVTLLGCVDCWLNGAYDGVSGQASHLGGAVPNGAKAADDFYLLPDFVYDLNTITATLLTTTFQGLVKPRAEIWSDCNGCPFQLLYSLDNPSVVETGLTEGLAFDGRPLRIVHATWNVANQSTVANRNIVLKGGHTYWLSVYGQTDGLGPSMQMFDVTYWGTAGRGVVKGKPAYKIDGLPTPNYLQFNFPLGCGPLGWHGVVDDCCIGCTDLNFSFCATPCKVIIDNGEGRRQLANEAVGSTSKFSPSSLSAIETRSADDFVLPGCQDYRICYVEACVLTNCPTFEGVFELYANDCNKPLYSLHGPNLTGQQYIATKIRTLPFFAFMDGKTVQAYELEFHDLNIILPGGRQYWISVGVKYTFSINERAFFCYNDDCRRTCLVRFNDGRVLTSTTLDDYAANHGCTSPLLCNGWARTGNDFSFLIAADGQTLPGPINSLPTCDADIDRDGVLSVGDIFAYLSTWFSGCP